MPDDHLYDVCQCTNAQCERRHFGPEQSSPEQRLKIKLDVETLLKDLSEYRDELVQAIKRPIGAWDAEVTEDGALAVTVRKDGKFKVVRIDPSGCIAVYSAQGREYQG